MNANILSSKNIKRFPKGGVIVREGDTVQEMYLLLQGNVGTYLNYGLNSEMQLSVLGQGSFHGEMSLFLGKEQKQTLVALTDVILLAVSRKSIGDFLAGQPDMAFSFIERLCGKLDSANELLDQYELSKRTQSGSKKSSLFPEGHGSYNLPLVNANTELLYEQKITCPLCGYGFGSLTMLGSRVRTLRTDNDLRSYYKDVEPMHYEIITCPNCFYSASGDQFPEVMRSCADAVNQNVGPYKLDLDIKVGTYRDTFTVFAGYYLALLCAPACVDNHQLTTAGLWLKLSRLYQDCEDENMSLYAARKSVDDYLYAYEHFNIPERRTQQLCYLVACQLMRLGSLDEARNYFFFAKSNKEGTIVLKRQADIRLDEIRTLKNNQ